MSHCASRDEGLELVVTIEDVRAFAMQLPRTTEALVQDRVKFRVGRMVYVAFSRDETVMGFGFPRRSVKRWWLRSRTSS
jgi:hypothetical protein